MTRMIALLALVFTLLTPFQKPAFAVDSIFDGPIAEYALTRTPAGRDIVGHVCNVPAAGVAPTTMTCFRQRILWQAFAPLRQTLINTLLELKAPGANLQNAPNLASGDIYAFLTEAQHRLEADAVAIQDATFMASATPVNAQAIDQDLLQESNSASPNAGIDPALLLQPKTLTQEVQEINTQLPGWQHRLANHFRNYWDFFHIFIQDEGQLRTLIGLPGQRYSGDFLRALRRTTFLLGALDDYSRARVVYALAAHEDPVVYAKLNLNTKDALDAYRAGGKADPLLKARKTAAQTLGLSDVVSDFENRLLKSIETVENLCGNSDAGARAKAGTIDQQRMNLEKNQRSLEALSRKIDATEAGIDKTSLQAQYRILEGKRDQSMEQLMDSFTQMARLYPLLELSAHMREGRIDSEFVQPLDLPDGIAVSKANMERWKKYYEFALARVIELPGSPELAQMSHDDRERIADEVTKVLVRDDLILVVQSKILLSTRRFWNQMNDLSKRLTGKDIKDLPIGQEAANFKQSVIKYLAIRLGAIFAPLSAAFIEWTPHWAQGFVITCEQHLLSVIHH